MKGYRFALADNMRGGSPDLHVVDGGLADPKLPPVPGVAAFALGRAAERTVEALWATIGRIADAFSQAECAHDFSACGYDPDW